MNMVLPFARKSVPRAIKDRAIGFEVCDWHIFLSLGSAEGNSETFHRAG
jgi:hypothetical protein